jgi:hypothetical protein
MLQRARAEKIAETAIRGEGELRPPGPHRDSRVGEQNMRREEKSSFSKY